MTTPTQASREAAEHIARIVTTNDEAAMRGLAEIVQRASDADNAALAIERDEAGVRADFADLAADRARVERDALTAERDHAQREESAERQRHCATIDQYLKIVGNITIERDAARAKLEAAEADAMASEMMLKQVCGERDAARTERDALRDMAYSICGHLRNKDKTLPTLAEVRDRIARLTAERDAVLAMLSGTPSPSHNAGKAPAPTTRVQGRDTGAGEAISTHE
jgi:hypothetical protein